MKQRSEYFFWNETATNLIVTFMCTRSANESPVITDAHAAIPQLSHAVVLFSKRKSPADLASPRPTAPTHPLFPNRLSRDHVQEGVFGYVTLHACSWLCTLATRPSSEELSISADP